MRSAEWKFILSKVRGRKESDCPPVADNASAFAVAMLCQACQSIFTTIDLTKRPAEQTVPRTHHESFENLKEAAESGCGICISLLDQPGADKILFGSATPFTKFNFDNYLHAGLELELDPVLQFTYTGRTAGDNQHLREFLVMSLTSEEIRTISSDTDHTNSVNPFGLARWWLKRCMESHGMCIPYYGMVYTPKRLIRMLPGPVRLIETAFDPPPENEAYATLSHCWGKNPTFHVLTADNISAMKTELPLEVLPPTFQHAIEVCHQMRVRYLWIDSLCIIQRGEGSAEDWIEHATSMRQIYEHALFNISADRASSAEEGFLYPRDPTAAELLVVRDRNVGKQYKVVDLELMRRCLQAAPIADRGWVLQERLLSQRILHFTSQQVFWECRDEFLACETYPYGIPRAADQQNWSMASISASVLGQSYESALSDAGSHFGRFDWYRILEDYTRRKLSMPDKDKFTALAGMVEKMKPEQSGEYVAGFFVTDMVIGLLWYCLDPGATAATGSGSGPSTTKPAYRAPSWSWARHDVPISFNFANFLTEGRLEHIRLKKSGDFNNGAKVISAKAEPADAKLPTGPIQSAQVTLLTYTTKVTWNGVTQDRREPRLLRFPDLDIAENVDIIGAFDSLGDSAEGALALLLVHTRRHGAMSLDAGLIVRLAQSNSSEYERVGCWWCTEPGVAVEMKKTGATEMTLI